MAISGKGKGIQIIVGADYNGKDLKRAERDVAALRKQYGATQGPIAGMATKLRSMLGPALIAAGAAAGALAVKLGVDGVKAAIADQKTVEVLAQTLQNLGMAHEQTGIEDFIAQMESATGVADESLRPAFGRLVAATGDVNDAMSLMQAAMDTSVATGKDFKTVYEAMARAISTNTAGRLGTYGVQVDQATVKTEGMTAAIIEATGVWGGSAAREAKTLEGRMRILATEAGNVQEAFGYGFFDGLGGFDKVGDDADNMAEALRAMKPAAEAAGESIGEFVNLLGELVGGLGAVGEAAEDNDGLRTFLEIVDSTIGMSPAEWFAEVTGWFGNTEEAAYDAAAAHEDYRDAAIRGAEGSREAADALAQIEDEARDAGLELQTLKGILSETNTLMAYEAAWDDLRKQVKDTGKELGIYEPAQRDTTKAMHDMIAATGEAAVQQFELYGKTGIAEEGLKRLTKQFDVTKMSPDAAALLLQPFQALIDDLAAAGYDTTVLQAKLDALKSKTINVTVIETWSRRSAGGDGYDWRNAEQNAYGGLVRGPGGPRDDAVPRWLSNGEFVVQAPAVARLGLGAMQAINRGELPMTNGRNGGGGLTINGGLHVTTTAGERADESVPRALRRLAFVAGL